MFYTKYRPQTFSEIAKPNETAESLAMQLKSGKTSHAYLFVGSRGTGKTTTARILAKSLNCSDILKNGDPCNKCANCLSVKNSNSLDLIEIDAASNRGIDDIRDLKDRVRLAPVLGKYKVYIIDEVHMLTTEAFNALLKTLEEPPKQVVFILCTTELHKVPDTIKSRCQVFKFKRASMTQLVKKLGDIAKSEGADVEKSVLDSIARSSLGGYRDAETLLQQVIEGGVDLASLVSSNSTQSYFDFIDLLLQQDTGLSLRLVNKLFDDGTDLYSWTGGLMQYLRNLMFIQSKVPDALVEVPEDLVEQVSEQAKAFDNYKFIQFTEAFIKAQNSIKSSFIPQLPLEIAVLELSGNATSEEQNHPKLPKNPDTKTHPKLQNANDGKKQAQEKEITKEAQDSIKSNKVTLKIQEESHSKKVHKNLALELVESKWNDVLSLLASINSSIQTLLKQGRIVRTEDGYIELEVFYAFHKERLESPKNKKMVEDVLMEVFGVPQSIKCILNPIKPEHMKSSRVVGELTDYNVAPVSVFEVFDGGLPLGK